jgi:predicted GNAT family acetyltransferase
MELEEFIALHEPALEKDPARHNLILGLLERARGNPDHNFRLWSLGQPGACAIRTGRAWGVLLGEVNEAQARQLARDLADEDYPAVQGQDDTVRWFVAEAQTQGKRFTLRHQRHILALDRPPSRPDAPGHARPATANDAALLMDWMVAFQRDADLDDPLPTPEGIANAAAQGRYFLWVHEGRPVALAGKARRGRNWGSISPVYTPREFRGRGFAGAITAHLVDQIFAEDRQIACLYVDVNNPASNRCYAKLGFTRVCEAHIFRRITD